MVSSDYQSCISQPLSCSRDYIQKNSSFVSNNEKGLTILILDSQFIRPPQYSNSFKYEIPQHFSCIKNIFGTLVIDASNGKFTDGSVLGNGYGQMDNNVVKMPRSHLCQVIDEIGANSAKAQRLKMPITSSNKLLDSSNRLYLLFKGDTAIGMLKVGKKSLWVSGDKGIVETHLLCVLDDSSSLRLVSHACQYFYIREPFQRLGYGKDMFDCMLKIENVSPNILGYDRPSMNLLNFLKKKYCLETPHVQFNNFVTFSKTNYQSRESESTSCSSNAHDDCTIDLSNDSDASIQYPSFQNTETTFLIPQIKAASGDETIGFYRSHDPAASAKPFKRREVVADDEILLNRTVLRKGTILENLHQGNLTMSSPDSNRETANEKNFETNLSKFPVKNVNVLPNSSAVTALKSDYKIHGNWLQGSAQMADVFHWDHC